MNLRDVVHAIEKVLRDAPIALRWEALEAWLQQQFGDEAEPKLFALRAYLDLSEATPEVTLMVAALERELGIVTRLTARHPEMKPEPKPPQEDQVAVKKPKAKARSGFQAAKETAKAASSKKAPKRQGATVKAKRGKPKPAPRPKPPRPIYDQLVAGQVVAMPRTDLVPWPGLNPRTVFDKAELQELADSIAAEGVKVPLVVKLNAKAPHWIAYGERRWKAAALAHVDQLPVIVMSLEEREAFLEAVVENAQRSALSPLEEARALERLKTYFPEKKQAELGAILGHAEQPWVSNRLRLLKLPPVVQQLGDDGLVSATALRDSFLVFLQLTDEGARQRVWKAAAAKVVEAAKAAKDLPLGDDRVERLVGEAASHKSHELAQYPPSYVGAGVRYVTEAAHAKCGCGGPKFNYQGYSGGRVRCFNGAWFQEETAKVKGRLEAKQAKQTPARPVPGVVTTAPLLGEKAAATWSWPSKQDVIPKNKRIPTHALLAFHEGGAWRFDRVADVELLDPELVYQVESEDEDGRPSVDLIYLDPPALQVAQDAIAELVVERVRARQQEALAAELQAIGRSRITAADLVELLGLYEAGDDVVEALKELGVEEPEGGDRAYEGDWLRKFLASVDAEALVRACLLVAHRQRNRTEEERGWSLRVGRNKVEQEVELEVGRAQLLKLFPLLSFIPQVITHTPTEESEADGDTSAGTEEAWEEEGEEAALSGAADS